MACLVCGADLASGEFALPPCIGVTFQSPLKQPISLRIFTNETENRCRRQSAGPQPENYSFLRGYRAYPPRTGKGRDPPATGTCRMCFGDLARFESASPALLQALFWRGDDEVETWNNSSGWLDVNCSYNLGLRRLSALLVTAMLSAPRRFRSAEARRLFSSAMHW